MNTCTVLAFLALVAGCLAQEDVKEAAKKCMSEVGAADKEEMEKDEGKRKCFLKCMMASSGVMDEDGKPNVGKAEKMAEEKISDEGKRKEAVDAFKLCADKTNESQETNPCEKASVMFDCMVENNEDRKFFEYNF
ncbi:uncharacterized protein [Anabrus simplex]|uniref:uncharacterized protein n=1 Tax=Anabrus simplex TaxID=316456 RepID=UPI0035A3353D